MMVVIEYINVFSQGKWQNRLSQHQIGQYFFAALLGTVPGCLGSFTIVSMYTHRMISFGAVVSAMIATSGDESFAMLSLIPKDALLIIVLLFILGVAGGALTDAFMGKQHRPLNTLCPGHEFHIEGKCECFPAVKTVLEQWKKCSPIRGMLSFLVVALLYFHLFGIIGPNSWDGTRISLFFITFFAFYIIATVPDHFLKNYFWEGVLQKQSIKIFLWTFSTLGALFFLSHNVFLEEMLRENQWTTMIAASVVGLIPESGPHYIFTTLYVRDLIPFSVLLANSIVQDGHGLLPLLAYSRRAFFGVKSINLIIGLVIGSAVMLAGK
jgi:hypothetical protein